MRQTTSTQTQKALLLLRQLILDGLIETSKRLTEARAAELTGVSRTPVRAALHKLAEEGLVRELPTGGFDVQTFSEQDISDAIEVRGALEGLAARFAAERGVPDADLKALYDLVARMDEALDSRADAAFDLYGELNAAFHALLAKSATPALRQSLDRAASTPFASPSAFTAMQGVLPEARRLLTVANDQHRCVLDAIANREGARAETLMREHARLAMRNLRLGLQHQDALRSVPGGGLIRSTSAPAAPAKRRRPPA